MAEKGELSSLIPSLEGVKGDQQYEALNILQKKISSIFETTHNLDKASRRSKDKEILMDIWREIDGKNRKRDSNS